MTTHLHVVLLRDENDPQYQKYLAVLNACIAAGIDDMPPEVDEYFGGDGMDNDPAYPLEIDFKPNEWYKPNESEEGYDIDVRQLPEGVKTIRVYMSW